MSVNVKLKIILNFHGKKYKNGVAQLNNQTSHPAHKHHKRRWWEFRNLENSVTHSFQMHGKCIYYCFVRFCCTTDFKEQEGLLRLFLQLKEP